MADSRRAFIKVEYDGKDITDALSETVISLEYVDKASNEADELTLNCHDREGNWHNEWYPKLGKEGDGSAGSGNSDYTEIAKALQAGTSEANLQRLIDESDLTAEQGRVLQRVTASGTWSQFAAQNPQYRGESGKVKLVEDIKAGVIK